MKTLWITLVVLVLLLSGPHAPAESRAEIAAQLRKCGFTESVSATITEALVTAQESETIDPIVKLFNEDQEAGYAAAALLSMSEPGSDLLVAALRKESVKQPENMLFAFLFTKNKKAVDYLVERLQKEKSPEIRKTIVLVLEGITSEEAGDDHEAWKAWWERNREAVTLSGATDIDQRTRTMLAKMRRKNLSVVHERIAMLIDDKEDTNAAGEVLDSLGNVLEDAYNAVEEAEKFKYSPEARKGVELFRHGKLDEAEVEFRNALKKNSDDRYSLYLLGCLLIEMDRLWEAEDVFDRICTLETRNQMAMFLRDFCRRRQEHEQQDILDTLIHVLDDAEFDKTVFWGWNDRIVPVLVGQASIDEGMFVCDQDALTVVAEQNSDTPEILAGVALMRPRTRVLPDLLACEDKFTNSAPCQAATLYTLIQTSGSKHREAIMEMTDSLCELDPKNGCFPLLRAYYRDYDHSQDAHAPEDDTLPLNEQTLAAVEEALNLPRFSSHAGSIMKMTTRALEMTGSAPFAAQSGFIAGMSDIACNSTFRDIARRLDVNSIQASTGGNTNQAIHAAQLIVRLGKRIASGNNLVTNRITAHGIERMGLERLIEIYKQTGDKDKLLKLSTEREMLCRETLRIASHMNPAPLCIVPVPKLQKAFMEAAMQDEVGLTLRLPEE